MYIYEKYNLDRNEDVVTKDLPEKPSKYLYELKSEKCRIK